MERKVIVRTSRKALLAVCSVFGLMVLSGVVLFTRAKSEQIIPEDIKKQLSFNVILPIAPETLKVDKSSIKYTTEEKLLVYEVNLDDGNKLVVSEQPSPESFIDVPQSYDKLISSMQQYAAFDTQKGRVFLTKPENLKGGQTAVMNSSGVLLFIRPDKGLSDDAWKKIFNDLEIVK